MTNDTATTTQKSTGREDDSLISRLFAAGAHFGFSKSRRHPSALPYIFGTKQRTDVFDLEKTSALLADAASHLRTLGSGGKTVLFVGTKEEAKRLVLGAAEKLDMPHITNRWIGGTLTNFAEITKRRARLAEIEEQRASGELERKYTKKERLMLTREAGKLAINFGGLRGMDRLPDALLIVDPRHEVVAVREAKQKGIPIIALMGSDCSADGITKPVYLNDAHTTSLSLALELLTAAFAEGRAAAPAPEEVAGEARDRSEEQGERSARRSR